MKRRFARLLLTVALRIPGVRLVVAKVLFLALSLAGALFLGPRFREVEDDEVLHLAK